MDGADLRLTQRALDRKRRLQEAAGPKKEVDRRASKNRKIRYIVHEKLVNFMTPVDNTALIDAQSVLQSLFGQRKTLQQEKGASLDIRLL